MTSLAWRLVNTTCMFRRRVLPNRRGRLRLEVGQSMRLDLSLSLDLAKAKVDVVGFAESLKTADASVGEVVEQQSIRELPLNGRMLLDLALTVPGSHMSHGAQAGDMHPLYWRPGQASALSIGGSRPNANYFLLDGVTNTDPTFNTQNLSVSPDAVLEFRVQTGSYSAEMGRRRRRTDQYRDARRHEQAAWNRLRIPPQ